MTSLDDGIPVPTEPLLSSLPSLPAVLWPVRAGPVSLGAGGNVQEVAGSAGDATPDWQLFPSVADCHRLHHLARVKVGVRAESAFTPSTSLKAILHRSGQPDGGQHISTIADFFLKALYVFS